MAHEEPQNKHKRKPDDDSELLMLLLYLGTRCRTSGWVVLGAAQSAEGKQTHLP